MERNRVLLSSINHSIKRSAASEGKRTEERFRAVCAGKEENDEKAVHFSRGAVRQPHD
jgi:hypothetical protein